MKTLFGMAAVVAVAAISLAAIDSADARGIRGGGGGISTNSIQVGPRVTSPVIRPERVAPQPRPPRQINGPRENGRGINCHLVQTGTRQIWRHNHRTSRMELTTRPAGNIRCPERY